MKLKQKKVIFGIRPEDIHDNLFSENNNNNNIFDAKIEFVEYLGSEMNIYLTAMSNSFIARFNHKIDSGSKKSISITFDIDKGHFFNTEDGNIL